MESPHFQNGEKVGFSGNLLDGSAVPEAGPARTRPRCTIVQTLSQRQSGAGGAGGQSATADGGSRKPLPANGTRCKDQHGRAWQDRPGKPVRSDGRFTAGSQRFALPSRKPAPLPWAAGAAGPPVSPAEPTATRQTCHVSGSERSIVRGQRKEVHTEY